MLNFSSLEAFLTCLSEKRQFLMYDVHILQTDIDLDVFVVLLGLFCEGQFIINKTNEYLNMHLNRLLPHWLAYCKHPVVKCNA